MWSIESKDEELLLIFCTYSSFLLRLYFFHRIFIEIIFVKFQKTLQFVGEQEYKIQVKMRTLKWPCGYQFLNSLSWHVLILVYFL